MKKYLINILGNQGDRNHYQRDLTIDFAYKSFSRISEHFESIGYNKESEISHLQNSIKAEDLMVLMKKLAFELEAGDILTIHFVGHSYRTPEEPTRLKSSYRERGWALKDRVFFHFEFWELIRNFKSGVKVVLLVDSCFGGFQEAGMDTKARAISVFERNAEKIYNPILAKPRTLYRDILASVVIISAADYDEESVIGGYSELNNETLFNKSFFDAVNNLNNSFSLMNLYEEMMMTIAKFYIGTELVVASRTVESNQRIIPRWHYVQGGEFTAIHRKLNPFNN